MKLRTCIKCNIDKQIDEFHPHGSGGLGGYDSRCKQCKSKACSIIYKLKKQFPKPKNAVCECCGSKGSVTHGKRKFDGIVLDHCHETHTFRGWICQNCNRGIGCLGDNIDGLKRAIKYLQAAETANLAKDLAKNG